MNPLSTTVGQTDFPSMEQVRKNLPIEWYRCPINRHKLRELTQTSDRQGYFQALGHIGILCLSLAQSR